MATACAACCWQNLPKRLSVILLDAEGVKKHNGALCCVVVHRSSSRHVQLYAYHFLDVIGVKCCCAA